MPSSAPARFAHLHGLPFLSESELPTNWPAVTQPLEYWQRHGILPLSHSDEKIAIAVASISALRALNTLAFAAGSQVEAYWCAPDTLSEGLRQLAAQLQNSPSPSAMTPDNEQQDHDTLKTLRQLVQQAASQAASDIHIDPAPEGHVLRLRIDGRLHTVEHWPRQRSARLIRQFKLQAGLDIAQTRLPQDGALHMALENGRNADLRLSTLPALHGEKVVLRFIPAGQSLLKLADISLSSCHYSQVVHALGRHGMVLVTGPTGSGKTSTLYRMLMALEHRHQLNLCSVEDPVEARLEGLTQIQVHSAQGLGFATILRALLRQDPDVLMVGEIRDGETAGMAIRAAQTGHLLLSTLHTGSATETFNRLHALGIPFHDMASAVTLVVSQRLVRRLCPSCRQPDIAPAPLLQRHPCLKETALFRAEAGCDACREGYQGRMALFEVVPMTTTLRNALLTSTPIASAQALLATTKDSTLSDAALRCLAAGQTSLDEVLNVLS